MSWPWSQLGLSGPSDLPEIRRAYAEKLKITHPEDDPEGFQRLHSAYQLASRMARQQRRGTSPPEPQAEHLLKEPKPPQPREDDFDEPLRDGGEALRRPCEDGRENFDFDELLQEGEEIFRRSGREDEEQDFDFERLLQDEEEAPHCSREKEEERDWDYEQLFAEGEAERAEARRRRGEERRRAQAQARAWARERQKAQEWTQKREWWQRREEQNTYDRERQDQFRQKQDHWENTEIILHTIEMMYNAQAEVEAWKRFFMSPLFQQTRSSLDLVFGLEDFVSTKDLSQEIKLALFMAYGFDKGPGRPELRPLFQMLLPAWKEKRSRDRQGWKNLFLGLGAAVVMFVLLNVSLDSTAFLGVAAVAAVFGFGLLFLWCKTLIQRFGRRKAGLRMAAGGALVLALILIPSLWKELGGIGLRDMIPARDPREQTCRYITKDFGVKVGSLYNLREVYANDTYGNVFYLEDAPDSKRFLAGPDDGRDLKNGKPGYTTNLPEMLLLWELREFAQSHKLEPVDSLDQDLEAWETTGTFLITLPIDGGEEIISDLGELLEGLREEKWYRSLASRCELVLCSQEMGEGRVVLIRTQPGLTLYSAEQCLEIYEETFAHKCCAQILKELKLDRDFLSEGEERYILTNEGRAWMKGVECVKLYGLDEDGAVAMEYYIYPKERNIYCVPGNFWDTGNREDQIGFYRLLHWGDRGTYNLFYPWLRVS